MTKEKEYTGKFDIEKVENLTRSITNVIDKSNVFMQISTRAADPDSLEIAPFHVFDDAKLAKLAENMPEINRATRSFGRRNSQAMDKLMSLTMISQSPYRSMKQCLAKIETKRGAVKENIFKLAKDRLKLDMLKDRVLLNQKKLKEKADSQGVILIEDQLIKIQYRLGKDEIEIQELVARISDTMLYLEGAFKEIGVYQDAYFEIKKNKNIPDNWDEKDFELSEIEHHVKTCFQHAIRDVMAHGNLGMGTLEYLEQFGVNPMQALMFVRNFKQISEQAMAQGRELELEDFHNFIDQMYEKYKDGYIKAMKRIGVETLISDWCIYREDVDNMKHFEEDQEETT